MYTADFATISAETIDHNFASIFVFTYVHYHGLSTPRFDKYDQNNLFESVDGYWIVLCLLNLKKIDEIPKKIAWTLDFAH